MSDQGEPLSWRKTLQEQLLDVFDRHKATVAVGLTEHGIAIRSQDVRVDATTIGTVGPQEIEKGTLRTPVGTPSYRSGVHDEGAAYRLVLIAKHSVNLRAIHTRAQEAELVIGKGNVVLKDRYGPTGQTLTEREVARILANAADVVQV